MIDHAPTTDAPTSPTANSQHRTPVTALVERLLSGDRAAVSRMMSIMESRRAGYREALTLLAPHTGRAYLIGVTGPPGVGKSTLVNALIKLYRDESKTVGVIAVDPTSALSGGAILGDRIRMLSFYSDPGVFVRSMASRGQLGGLAATTADVSRVMDAAGMDIVLVETVGVGQDEMAIAGLADTTLLVEMPGMGDDVQALKAGILEIADVIVINKADREGADRLANQIKTVMRLLPSPEGAWIPPIVKTVASENTGIDELGAAIEKHRAYLSDEGRLAARRRNRLRVEVVERAHNLLMRRLTQNLEATGALDSLLDDLSSGKLDPVSAAQRILDEAVRNQG